MSEARSRFWQAVNSRRIEKRIIVEANLVLETPAHFGDGDADDLTDMPLLMSTDVAGQAVPLLPGATLTGALRAYLNHRQFGFRADVTDKMYALSELLFGAQKGDEVDDGRQSALIIEDALGSAKATIEMRESVKIDNQTRTADVKEITVNGDTFLRGELFDIQLWAAGTTFPIRFELLLMQTPRQMKVDDYQKQVLEAFLIALEGLTDGSITLGARKNRGLGRFSLQDWRVRTYHLNNNVDELLAWLEAGNVPLAKLNIESKHPAEADIFKKVATRDAREWLLVDFYARIDPHSSLLIRDSSSPDSAVDMVHLRSCGQPVLSGTSLTGALRARAERILNLINEDETSTFLDALFGGDPHQTKSENLEASRLIIEEYVIKDGIDNLVQNRVSIDRFTGGARDTALFNEQPLFGKEETCARMKWRLIKPTPIPHEDESAEEAEARCEKTFQAQIGLMLLLLKDLWTGDLPVGGELSVGRGRFAGIKAEIALHRADESLPQMWTIADGKRPDGYHQLQEYVDALWTEVQS